MQVTFTREATRQPGMATHPGHEDCAAIEWEMLSGALFQLYTSLSNRKTRVDLNSAQIPGTD